MSTLVTILSAVAAGVLAIGAGLALFTAWNSRRAERMVPRDGRFLDLEHARLHYRDLGSGPAMVMIHGLSGQIRNFSALAEDLARDHRVILVDRPGSGYSVFKGNGDRGLAGQAQLILQLIDALGLERPLLVGHSLGGAVALAAAIRHSGKLGGLALLAPLTQPMDGVPSAFAALVIPSAAIRWIIAWTLAAPLGRLGARKTYGELFGPEAVPADFEIRGGAALALRPAAFLSASADVRAGLSEMPGLAARYPGLDIPVGIFFGKQDRILKFEDHGPPTAKAIPGAELTAVDGGHMLPVTQAALAGDWIRERMRHS